MLDRLVVATQLRYPAVGDLARAVRFRYFEEPVVRQNRRGRPRRRPRGCWPSWTTPARSGDGDEAMRRGRGAGREPGAADPAARAARRRGRRPCPTRSLEVLTRRYYRSREPAERARRRCSTGRSCVTADYDLRGTRLHLVALMAECDDLPAALAAVARAGRPTIAGAEHPAASTSTSSWPDRPGRRRRDGGAAARACSPTSTPLPAMRRVTVTVCTPGGDVETVTFRPSAGRAGRGPDHPRHAPADRAAARTSGG